MSAGSPHGPLSGYRIVRQLAASADRRVYRGIRESDARPVAIKMTASAHPAPALVARLRREARLLQLFEHPRIIGCYTLERHKNGVALILEDFDGTPLASSLPVPGPAPLDVFFPIAIQCAEALAVIQDRSIVHRDVKPSNLLWNAATQQLKLIDFGIADEVRSEGRGIESPDELEGTLAYISPEQTGRIGHAVDQRSDYYSLGIALFEYLTGKKPFYAEDAMGWVHCHITRALPNEHNRYPEVPEALFRVLEKLTEKDPGQRYQNAFGLKRDLERLFEQWRSRPSVSSSFDLGSEDVPSRLLIDRILVTLRDVTDLRQTLAEATVRKRELEIVGEIMAVEPRLSRLLQ